MPFADELSADGVAVVPYHPSWASQAVELIDELQRLLPDDVAVEHIGSTSIPGMAAKVCIDLMIVVPDLEHCRVEPSLAGAGFRRRREPWNNIESAEGREWPKMVFAGPVGGPRCNIHVRAAGAATTRLTRLFRDYLIANPDKVVIWSDFKRAIADATPDLAGYGRIKAPAWWLLMECANHWATQTGWVAP